MARLLVIASVALCMTAVLSHGPLASAADDRNPDLHATASAPSESVPDSAATPELSEDLFHKILDHSDADLRILVNLAGTCKAMHGLAQPVLQWFRNLSLGVFRRPGDEIDAQLHAQYNQFYDEFLTPTHAATRFVKLMTPRAACDLLEMILRDPARSYGFKAQLLGKLHAMRPDLFAVEIAQITPAILTHLENQREWCREDPSEDHLSMTSEDTELFKQLYPEPLIRCVLFRASICHHLKIHYDLWDVPMRYRGRVPDLGPLVESIPSLARLGIRFDLGDFLYRRPFPVQHFPFLSMEKFWLNLDSWLQSPGYHIVPLLRLPRVLLDLIAIPEFVREVELDGNLNVFERYLTWLRSANESMFNELSRHNQFHSRRKIAAIMERIPPRSTIPLQPVRQYRQCDLERISAPDGTPEAWSWDIVSVIEFCNRHPPIWGMLSRRDE